MTLIVGMRGPSAIVFAVDSQETITQYDKSNKPYEVRVTVQKLTPIAAGKYQVAICGAGNAELIDSFSEKIRRAIIDEDSIVNTQQNPAGIKAIHARLEKELRQFYKEDVKLCPDKKNEKWFKLFIAGACPLARQYNLWVSDNATLREAYADKPELSGWNHELYIETAGRFFSKGITVSQAVLASIYTLTIAKNTCNYVRDPFSVAVVDANGIHLEDANYVRAMGERLDEYEAQMNRLFLLCADTTVSVPKLEDSLEEFNKSALKLHREQIDRQAEVTAVEELFRGSPQGRLPKGPIYVSAEGRLRVEHGRAEIQAADLKAKKVKLLGGGPFKLTVHCRCGNAFQARIEDLKSFSKNNRFACEKCNYENVVIGIVLKDVSDI